MVEETRLSTPGEISGVSMVTLSLPTIYISTGYLGLVPYDSRPRLLSTRNSVNNMLKVARKCFP